LLPVGPSKVPLEEEKQLAKRTTKRTTGKPARKAPARVSRAAKDKKTAKTSVASRLPPMTPEKAKAAQRKFERGVIARGEAAPAGKPLPPGATHEIVGKDAEGEPILKRKRFSLK